MKELTIAAIVGLIIGIAFLWADYIETEREMNALIQELNAYRVMAGWDKFEEGRTK